MELDDLDDLPRAYRIGLRLHELGADDDLIGECLGIDPSGVSTLIEIGQQKLESESRLKRQSRSRDSYQDAPPAVGDL